MATEPLPCPKKECGRTVKPKHDGWHWYVTCEHCYDGAPDAKGVLEGSAPRLIDAIDDWNLRVTEWLEDQRP